MNFDLEKLQAVAELGEVIRLQNQALDQLASFRKSRPYLIVPNLAKMVEENLKENVQILYKELNNLHKPQTEQKRHICRSCKMAFAVALPGGICDECRSKQAVTGRPAYGARPESSVDEAKMESLAPAEELNASEATDIDANKSMEVNDNGQDSTNSESLNVPVASDRNESSVHEPETSEPTIEEPPTGSAEGNEPEIKEPPSESESGQRL